MEWKLGVVANSVVAASLLAIAATVIGPLVRTRQWKANRLATAASAIFFACAVHHGLRAADYAIPTFSSGLDNGSLGWAAVGWDLVVAAVAVQYWRLRGASSPSLHGASLFEDLKDRQQQALELNDRVVQGLVAAEMALRLDEREESAEAIRNTLVNARAIVAGLLDHAGSEVHPGDLVRKSPASVVPAQED